MGNKIATTGLITYDPRELSAYTYAEAARILGVASSTLRAWKKGQNYNSKVRGRVIFREAVGTTVAQGVSYYDLAELFVLKTLREKGYRLDAIRQALAIAQDKYGIERLLLHRSFRHDGGKEFFLERLTDLVTLSPTHQLAAKTLLNSYVQRLDYDVDGLSSLFRPVVKEVGVHAEPLIVVNPLKSFGRPMIERRGIRTSSIVMRVRANEAREHIIEDFGLTGDEFDQALLLEAA